MGEKITVSQLARRTGADPNFLLSKLRDSGLPQRKLDDTVDSDDTEKITQSLVRPKKTLSKKNYKAPTQPRAAFDTTATAGKPQFKPRNNLRPGQSAYGSSSSSSSRGSHSSHSSNTSRGPGGGNSKAPRGPGGGGYGGGNSNASRGPGGGGTRPQFSPNSRPVAKPAWRDNKPPGGAPARPGDRSQFKPNHPTASSFKNKNKSGLDPRAAKTSQRYGVKISEEDALEIRELVKAQKVQDVADMSTSALRRVVSTGIRHTSEIENIHKFVRPSQPVAKEITIGGDMSLTELAQKLAIKKQSLFGKVSKMGLIEKPEDPKEEIIIEKETIILIAEELGYAVVLEDSSQVIYKSAYDPPADAKYVSRPPIVTVMGHVDHGKTTLLDHIRQSKQADNEAGNITQHFGAYSVKYKKDKITFFDTPGHAAFSDMRARGAKLTDIVVLVVAADDGLKPQTLEAIRHAQTAKAAIVVAINKMDVAAADSESVLKGLSSQGLQPEEWGGDIQCVKISAKSGDGVDKLLEAILAQSSIMELKAATNIPGRGYVIESAMDKNMGASATIILQHGEMKRGDILLCGQHYGRIKLIKDDEDKQIKDVAATVPVSILGLNGVPDAGDSCLVVDSEKEARRLIDLGKEIEEKPASTPQAIDIEELLNSTEIEPAQNNLIIKADVAGSLEAIKAMIGGLSNASTKFEIVAGGVGAVSESDISLARATEAIVIGFNVRADAGAKTEMKRTPVPEIHYYNVIYELVDQLDKLMVENLALQDTDKIIGLAMVKEVFSAKKYGQIAGCVVSEGTIYKDKPIRVLRESKVIYEGVLESLKRFKGDVDEVQVGVDCGIGVKDYKNVKVGDQIEVYDKLSTS